MFCKNCGNQLKEDSKFCRGCGTPVVKKSNLVAEENCNSRDVESSPPPSIVVPEKKNGWLKYLFIGVAALCAVGAGLWFFTSKEDQENKKVTEMEEAIEVGQAINNSWLVGTWEEIDYGMAPAELTINSDGTFRMQYIRSGVDGTYTIAGNNLILKGKIYSASHEVDEDGGVVVHENDFSESLTIVNNTLEGWKKVAVDNEGSESVAKIGVYSVLRQTYFHNEADAETVRRAFLIEDDEVYVEKISNGFGYVRYTNNQGRVTTGWLKMVDLAVW